MQITTIGLDIAKNVFQVHGIDAAEKDRQKATSPRPGYGVLRSPGAVPDRHGGLRHVGSALSNSPIFRRLLEISENLN
jgi:hypothetical protein